MGADGRRGLREGTHLSLAGSQENTQTLAPGSGERRKATSLLPGRTEGRDAVEFSSHPGAMGLQA